MAARFGLTYIGTGYIYRFAALRLINDHIAPDEVTDADLSFLENMTLDHSGTIIWRGEVYDETLLQSDLIQDQVSTYACSAVLRTHITRWIQRFAKTRNVVMDGRDTGTVVLPDAEIKVFVTSSLEHRVNNWRRIQYEKYGYVDQRSLEEYARQLSRRDHNDLCREISPLRCPADALCYRNDVEGFDAILADVSSAIQRYIDVCK